MNKDSDNKSICTLQSHKENNMDSIPCRIDFIRELMKNQRKVILPLIDISDDEESDSKDSNDTRHKLKKRKLDFISVIENMGGILIYVKSGTTGHTFHGIYGDKRNPQYEYGVKVVAYQKKSKYGDMYDIRRPENAEINMIKVLSKLVVNGQTPHIVLPICTFDTGIDTFVDLVERDLIGKDKKKYNEFVDRYENNEYNENVSILVSEWANRGDFLDFVRKQYTKFSPLHWKVFFFQIISVLAVIQSQYPSFRHNDLKANNILIHKIKKKNRNFGYTVVRKRYIVPNVGYRIKIWDFDFACIPGVVDNQKVNKSWTKAINVVPDKNRYYDMHYFFNTFIKKGFFPQFMAEKCVPKEAKEFVSRIVPKKYQKGVHVHKRGRILISQEYKTPEEVLRTDKYFEEFRRESTSKFSKGHIKQKKRTKSSKSGNNSRESESHKNIRRLLVGSD